MHSEKKRFLKRYLILEAIISRYRHMAFLDPRRKKNYESLILQADISRREIEEKIYSVEDELLIELLFQKYILGKTLEEISGILNYSKRHIERLHIKALEKIDV